MPPTVRGRIDLYTPCGGRVHVRLLADIPPYCLRRNKFLYIRDRWYFLYKFSLLFDLEWYVVIFGNIDHKAT